MKTFIFVGPSIKLEDAKKILPSAIYLPPVACGDVIECVKKNAHRIAIIDGFFHNQAAVWHKEILFALSKSIEVWGASSMGALRAAELQAFGMHGIGKIYNCYHANIYNDDDEVAILHSSAKNKYLPMTDAMTNIRETLFLALTQGVIKQETHDLLVNRLKNRFYQERKLLSEVKTCSEEIDNREELVKWLKKNYIDQKELDAKMLLEKLSENAPLQKKNFTLNFTKSLKDICHCSS